MSLSSISPLRAQEMVSVDRINACVMLEQQWIATEKEFAYQHVLRLAGRVPDDDDGEMLILMGQASQIIDLLGHHDCDWYPDHALRDDAYHYAASACIEARNGRVDPDAPPVEQLCDRGQWEDNLSEPGYPRF
ncbi:hypothetical protein [Croceicoccus sp. Ery15]|uniref:hypothetical protein n=1 Tax=Croceicoccus sp. Ery15 TaxID=1703338 RepID=UPI001E50AFC3|nr:hypothetical protein [Croceicoccus sp. Ery15]